MDKSIDHSFISRLSCLMRKVVGLIFKEYDKRVAATQDRRGSHIQRVLATSSADPVAAQVGGDTALERGWFGVSRHRLFRGHWAIKDVQFFGCIALMIVIVVSFYPGVEKANDTDVVQFGQELDFSAHFLTGRIPTIQTQPVMMTIYFIVFIQAE